MRFKHIARIKCIQSPHLQLFQQFLGFYLTGTFAINGVILTCIGMENKFYNVTP